MSPWALRGCRNFGSVTALTECVPGRCILCMFYKYKKFVDSKRNTRRPSHVRCAVLFHVPDKLNFHIAFKDDERVPRGGPSQFRNPCAPRRQSGCTVHPQVCTSAAIVRRAQILPRCAVRWYVSLSPWQLASAQSLATIHVVLALRGTHSAVRCRRASVAVRRGASPLRAHTRKWVAVLACATLDYWGAISLRTCPDSATHARTHVMNTPSNP